MKVKDVVRDERTVAVENASYRWGYLVLSFGLLLDVAYRSYARHEENWDLLILVMLGGFVSTLYQFAHRLWGERWWLIALATVVAAAAVAATLVILR